MEYTFNKENKEISVKLEEYTLVYGEDGNKQTISYAEVEHLRMHYPKMVDGSKMFSCTIYITDRSPIKLQSVSKNKSETSSHFNHYHQFIRVLHFHLKVKSETNFSYGMSKGRLTIMLLSSILIILASYPLILILREHAVIVYTIVPMIIGLLIYRMYKRRPSSYRPDFIPGEVLPTKL